jgi:hypothetical protein
MSDVTAPPAAPAENPQPAPAAPVRGRNIVGIVAFSVALFAFLLAVIPPTSFIAWIPSLAAIVLGIVGLTRKNQGKAFALTGLLVGIVAWILAIIVATASALVAVGTAIDEANDAPSAGSEVEAGEPEEAPAEAVLGDTVTNDEGVAFTVSSVTCGLPTAGEGFLVSEAVGQFCEVKLTIANGSNESINLSSWDFKGYVGEAEYEADGVASTFGGESISVDVNPGLATEAVVYFDLPADTTLEYVQYEALLSLSDALVVKVS